MTSRKGSAKERQRANFEQRCLTGTNGGIDDLFAREEARRRDLAEQREAARQEKACTSKNRYATRSEALQTAAACLAHGARGLQPYRCSYCGGWHLTSHPRTQDGGGPARAR